MRDDPNPTLWGVSYSQMLNMTSDSHLFRTREQLEAESWESWREISFKKGKDNTFLCTRPSYFHQYDHRFATFRGRR